MKTILSEREKEILMLVLHEYTSLEIADKLNLSIRTIETHRKNIIRKTKSKTIIGLVKFAVKSGFIGQSFFKRAG